jgi:flagellar hook-associated protein 2
MASSVSTTSSSYAAQIDALVTEYKATLSKSVTTLQTKQTSLNNLKTIYSSLDTKLETLLDSVTDLAETGSSSTLNLSTATSSDTSIVSVTSDGSPTIGNYDIFVNRLAKPDKIVSSKVTKTDSSLIEAGDYTFNININNKDYEIKVSLTDTSNTQNVLKKIASAINSSSAKSLIGASVINESSSTSRLMISSKNTGSENAVKLNDVSGDLLEKLGFFGKNGDSDTRVAKNGNFGGYYESNTSNLDSLFTLDGTEYTKSSNTIKDVIDGVTINLRASQKETDNDISITTEIDEKTIKSNIDTFIKNYNDVISFLNDKLNLKDGVRAVLSGDTTLVSLRSNLRSIVSGKVTTTSDSSVNMLSQIGLKINDDYTISWDDADKFSDMVEDSSFKISDLFNTTNGIANKLKSLIKPYTKTNGTLDIKKDRTSDQIESIADRIVTLQTQIDKKVEAYRKKYENLVTTLNNLNSQQSTMNSLLSYTYSSSSS